MESRRVTVSRNTGDTARQYIAEIVKKSTVGLRGNTPAEIISVMQAMDFSRSNIPTTGFGSDVLLSERNVNNLLDLIYLDLVMQYTDIFSLQDYLSQMKIVFDSVIGSNVAKVSNYVSQAKRFKKLSECHMEYTNVINEDFSESINSATEGLKLQQNRAAGSLRLPGIEENYVYPESSTIALLPYSTSVELVDESDPLSAYASDKSEPYFITLLSSSSPTNPDCVAITASDIDGAIVDLVVTFNTVVPVTRVTLVPFSTSPVTILGVYYSTIPRAEWNTGDMMVASSTNLTTDKVEFDINFERIYAREIHILMSQNHYVSSTSDTIIDETITASDYLASVVKKAEDAYPEYFIEDEDIDIQVNEICNNLRTIVERDCFRPVPETRAYTIGVCSVAVSNVSYLQTGKYVSPMRRMNGNLADISYAGEGSMTNSGYGGILNGCTLFSILTADDTIYLGSKDSSGYVLDGNVVCQNLTYTDGNYVEDYDYPGILTTHFLPLSGEPDFKMYVSGNDFSLSDTGSVIVKEKRSWDIYLPRTFMEDNDIFNGSSVTMRYQPALFLANGNAYNVESVDVVDYIGNPTFYNKDVSKIDSKYIYLSSGEVSMVYAPATETIPSEWQRVTLSGEPYYRVNDNRGFSPDGTNIIAYDSMYYIKESLITGPFDFMYYGIINEPATLSSTSEGYHNLTTGLPYIKGTIKVMSGEIPVTSVEYSYTSTSGGDMRDIKVPDTYPVSDLSVSYIPVDLNRTSPYLVSNIASHSTSEQFSSTKDKRIKLSNYSYTDSTVISSQSFGLQDGVFYLKNKYSIVYEPAIVFVNGVKAVNVTKYRSGMTVPTFATCLADGVYQYYIENGNTVIFNSDLKGTIMVYYYVFTSEFREQIEMYKSNYKKDDISPELTGYTILTNVMR